MPSYAGFFAKFASHGRAAPWPENTLGIHEYYIVTGLSVLSEILHDNRAYLVCVVPDGNTDATRHRLACLDHILVVCLLLRI